MSLHQFVGTQRPSSQLSWLEFCWLGIYASFCCDIAACSFTLCSGCILSSGLLCRE